MREGAYRTLALYLQEHRIVAQYTTTGTPEQNSVVYQHFCGEKL